MRREIGKQEQKVAIVGLLSVSKKNRNERERVNRERVWTVKESARRSEKETSTRGKKLDTPTSTT